MYMPIFKFNRICVCVWIVCIINVSLVFYTKILIGIKCNVFDINFKLVINFSECVCLCVDSVDYVYCVHYKCMCFTIKFQLELNAIYSLILSLILSFILCVCTNGVAFVCLLSVCMF